MKIIKIKQKQRDIIIGKILGDGHLETMTKGKTYRLKIEHSINQKEYVDWVYKNLQSIASKHPQERVIQLNDKQYKKYWFNTINTPSLRFYAQQFYHGRKKIVPKMIKRWLNPLTLAVWFMDDGSIKSKFHKAKIINTQSFAITDLKLLQSALLERYGIETKIRNQKEGQQIYLLSKTIDKFESIIRPYIVESMSYKLG